MPISDFLLDLVIFFKSSEFQNFRMTALLIVIGHRLNSSPTLLLLSCHSKAKWV